VVEIDHFKDEAGKSFWFIYKKWNEQMRVIVHRPKILYKANTQSIELWARINN